MASAALGLGLGAGKRRLERRADIAGIDFLQFRISLAGLAGLAKLHQRLAKIKEAVLGAFALGIAPVVGEQRFCRGARLALVEQGATSEVISPARAAMIVIFLGE